MSIERINMGVPVAVPVAEPRQNNEGQAISAAGENAELDGLIEEFITLLAERGRFSWGRSRARLQREKFEVRAKGLIKKFAGAAADMVEDRHARRRVRMRIYGDLILALQSLAANCDAQQQRRLNVLRWLWASSIVVGSATAVMLYGVLLNMADV